MYLFGAIKDNLTIKLVIWHLRLATVPPGPMVALVVLSFSQQVKPIMHLSLFTPALYAFMAVVGRPALCPCCRVLWWQGWLVEFLVSLWVEVVVNSMHILEPLANSPGQHASIQVSRAFHIQWYLGEQLLVHKSTKCPSSSMKDSIPIK